MNIILQDFHRVLDISQVYLNNPKFISGNNSEKEILLSANCLQLMVYLMTQKMCSPLFEYENLPY